MISLLSCDDFRNWLNDYVDETADPEIRRDLEQHVTSCPNCWVVIDTTKRTIQIYKGMDPTPLPDDVHRRLMAVIEKKCASRKMASEGAEAEPV